MRRKTTFPALGNSVLYRSVLTNSVEDPESVFFKDPDPLEKQPKIHILPIAYLDI